MGYPRRMTRIDPHTHSSYSDGTDAPAQLMRAARDAGLSMVGLTDHDTFAGWDEAAAAVGETGVALLRGVEISCSADGITVHLLGYLVDPADAALNGAFARTVEDRRTRARRMVDNLAADFPITWEQVLAFAPSDGPVGRPHIADALVAAGVVRRKLDGVLHGDHLGLLPGPGSEPGESRIYQPGDDVRRMDWSVTARTTQPHVRQMIADRELETWLVVDVSASLDFGTTGCEKRDLAVAAAAAVAFLNSGGGNRLGAIISNGDTVRRVPALSGRMHEQELLRTIATTPRAPVGVRGDLAAAIDALRRPERRRGMAVIISDFLGPINWMRPLRAIAGRHEVLGIEILDPRDVELPPVGDVILQDAETGRTREFTIDEQLRADFERAAAAHRADVARTLRRCDAPLLSLRTDRDGIADVVRFVASRRRGALAAR